jgi:hypothetical protein
MPFANVAYVPRQEAFIGKFQFFSYVSWEKHGQLAS